MAFAIGQCLRSPRLVEAGLHAAERTCEKRGLRFTPIRRAVLEALWHSGRPVSAYDLLHILETGLQRRLSPPTIYRALEFLQEQQLISRIETKNAFVPRVHSEHERACVFFICESCGTSAEVENPHVATLFETDAAELGFRIGKRVIELQGICANCLSLVHAAD
ncbi:Fur family transcriptional regulator [Pseudochelatococcus sp. B33]